MISYMLVFSHFERPWSVDLSTKYFSWANQVRNCTKGDCPTFVQNNPGPAAVDSLPFLDDITGPLERRDNMSNSRRRLSRPNLVETTANCQRNSCGYMVLTLQKSTIREKVVGKEDFCLVTMYDSVRMDSRKCIRSLLQSTRKDGIFVGY